jgi:sugar lactone lactonase YvrE
MSPAGLALDNAGDLLIGDRQFIRKVSAGIVRTVAGIAGPLTSSGDNGLAINAAFRTSSALASDAAGNFFISDVQSNRIRRVDTKTGLITTFAGTGVPVDSLDGDLAKFAHLVGPSSISINGNRLFVTEGGNAKIRQIDMQTGIITTLVGTGVQGFSPDNTPAAQALISNPAGVVADPFGNVYILDRNVNRLRMVSAATQTIVTVAGNGTEGFSGDGGPGTLAALSVNPVGPTFYTDDRQLGSDSAGNIFIPDVGNSRVRRLDRQTGIITTVAGNGQRGFSGDGGPATAASFFLPGGVTVDTAGNLFITDTFNNRIRKVDAKTGIITTVAGSGPATSTGDGGLATLATLDTPLAVALDAAQNLYITERNANKVRKVNAQTGIITTVAGRGGGFAGDGGPATNASFAAPGGITFDGNGNLFVIDGANNRVRAIRGPIP